MCYPDSNYIISSSLVVIVALAFVVCFRCLAFPLPDYHAKTSTNGTHAWTPPCMDDATHVHWHMHGFCRLLGFCLSRGNHSDIHPRMEHTAWVLPCNRPWHAPLLACTAIGVHRSWAFTDVGLHRCWRTLTSRAGCCPFLLAAPARRSPLCTDRDEDKSGSGSGESAKQSSRKADSGGKGGGDQGEDEVPEAPSPPKARKGSL